jgi:hypothetical protein
VLYIEKRHRSDFLAVFEYPALYKVCPGDEKRAF